MDIAILADAIMGGDPRDRAFEPTVGSAEGALHDVDHDGDGLVGIAARKEIGAWDLYDIHGSEC